MLQRLPVQELLNDELEVVPDLWDMKASVVTHDVGMPQADKLLGTRIESPPPMPVIVGNRHHFQGDGRSRLQAEPRHLAHRPVNDPFAAGTKFLQDAKSVKCLAYDFGHGFLQRNGACMKLVRKSTAARMVADNFCLLESL